MLDILLSIPALCLIAALLLGWLLDLALGDPDGLPHPVVFFGRLIAWGEHRLNRSTHRRLKGAFLAVTLIVFTFAVAFAVLHAVLWLLPGATGYVVYTLLSAIIIFFCLAGTTLIKEVRMVFEAVDRSIDEGRRQVARIVGRDTSELSAQEIRTAALETLAENLSDGVVAPLFWLLLLGPAGMLTYKMVNTLDSMIGYRTERYRRFGTVAARIDDVANYIPARLTALLMIAVVGHASKRDSEENRSSHPDRIVGHASKRDSEDYHASRGDRVSLSDHLTSLQRLEALPTNALPTNALSTMSLMKFVVKYGRQHASPNSGYPEAALAAILDCRFGGPHYYFGELFPKPYIGHNDRLLTTADMKKAVRVNRTAEVLTVVLVVIVWLVIGV